MLLTYTVRFMFARCWRVSDFHLRRIIPLSELFGQDARLKGSSLRGALATSGKKSLPAGNKGPMPRSSFLQSRVIREKTQEQLACSAARAAAPLAKLPPNFAVQPDIEERLETLPLRMRHSRHGNAGFNAAQRFCWFEFQAVFPAVPFGNNSGAALRCSSDLGFISHVRHKSGCSESAGILRAGQLLRRDIWTSLALASAHASASLSGLDTLWPC